MAERNLLCIEPDSDTVAEIRNALSPYGFGVESIPNGEEAIEWGRSHPTSLIILSVEPRKVGYAICNKLKRSPSLREIPLILISSEETQATFEQHRKLKAHADEYLLKPLNIEELLAKVNRLVPLGEKMDADEIHEADSGDIIIGDEEHAANGSAGHRAHHKPQAEEAEDLPTDIAASAQDLEPALAEAAASDTAQQNVLEPPENPELSPFQGETFDSETQAAFAALEAGANEGVAKPAEGGDMVDLRSLWSDEDLPPSLGWEAPPKTVATPADHEVFRPSTLADDDGIEPADEEDNPVTAPQLPVIAAASYSDDVLDVPPSPDDVEHIDESLHEAAPSAPVMVVDDRALREAEARNVELEARIGSLENERKALRKELEEARERFNQTATFSKEREFLALREIINKKEKDILDLREDLDAKERQILDHKDKIRELDRSRRDLEEKTLGFERSVVASTEKISELLGERDKSAEREKGLKARLDDAHGEIHKARDEVEAIRKRMAQEDARAKGEMDRARAEFEARLRETEEAHRTEVGRLKDDQTAGGAAIETAHQTELARIDAAHKAEVEALQKRLADEQAAANERFTTEVARLRREHEKAIAASKEEQGLQLTSERQAYEALTEAKERDHRNEILGMRRRHEEELTAAEERRQRDIVEQEQRRIAELDAAEGRRRAELQTRDENHHQRVTEIERRHLTEKTELGEKHRSDYDQALGRAARAEGELAARVQEVDQSHRRISSLEADLDAARAELGDRDVRIAQTRDRIAELESKVTDYEDQIVRAYQRLRADEKTTEKARRALAVALALIDERASVPVGVGAGTAKAGPSAAVSEDSNAKG
jgi:CheY-like chemotaxis protein/predicted  nucleic acid-binding Zn-ribbon protein